MTTPKLTEAQIDALRAIDHDRTCKWFNDDDWNASTFLNYVRSFGVYPKCTCEAGRAALRGAP